MPSKIAAKSKLRKTKTGNMLWKQKPLLYYYIVHFLINRGARSLAFDDTLYGIQHQERSYPMDR